MKFVSRLVTRRRAAIVLLTVIAASALAGCVSSGQGYRLPPPGPHEEKPGYDASGSPSGP